MIYTGRERSNYVIYLTVLLSGMAVVAVALAAAYWYFRDDSRATVPLSNIVTLAGFNGEMGEPFGIAASGGRTLVSDGEKGVIWEIGSDGAIKQFAAGLDTPSGIVFSGDDLIVADAGSHSIKRMSPEGRITTIAGVDNTKGLADGPAASATFDGPVGIAVLDGKIYVADTYNDRIRVIENGAVRTIAGSTRGFSDGPGGLARFDTPTGIAAWNGRLVVADTGNNRIRMVEPGGAVTTLAGTGDPGETDGSLGSAAFDQPAALVSGPGDTIYVADEHRIRMISGGTFPLVTTVSGTRRGLSDGSPLRSRLDRPSGLAIDGSGELLVADSENRLLRRITADATASPISSQQISALVGNAAAFRTAQPPRWPYDPPDAKRDIAGTLGEIRGEVIPGNDDIHFHNGLDIAGNYGETARFVRDEKVLRPLAAESFGTLRESIRMPTMGYIHVRLGRNSTGVPFGDTRFQFTLDPTGKAVDVRVPRGSHFGAGEAIGTLNPMNHVHLIAGRSASEMNALDALILPGIADSRPPVIEKVSFFGDEGSSQQAPKQGRIQLTGKTRIVMRAYDQVDGNAGRRRLGLYQAGYQILRPDHSPLADIQWTIRFDRLPDPRSIRLVYADGSKSGATGETIFNYTVTNRVDGDTYREDYFDPDALAPGIYLIRVFAADYFGNTSYLDNQVEVKR
jgi:NHL repeat